MHFYISSREAVRYEQYFEAIFSTVSSPCLDLRLNFEVFLMHIVRTNLNQFCILIRFVCKLTEERPTTSSMTCFDECKMSAGKLVISSKWS